MENSRRASFARKNAAVWTRFVPRCGAPLTWVPTTNSMRAGRLAMTRGLSRSIDRRSALASTLLGESNSDVVEGVTTGHAPRLGRGSRRLEQMKSSRAVAESGATKTGS